MNIYLFELKAQFKSFLIWTVSILLVYLLFMSGMYQAFLDSRDAVEQALSGVPPAIAAAFGLQIDTIFSFGGFYSFVFSYIALFGAIMAASMSVAVFSREKRAKCTDFLLTKPIGRARILLYKSLSVLTLLIAMNVLYVVVSIITYHTSAAAATAPGTLVWAACALFFTQLVFVAIAMTVAVFAKKIRSVSGAATAIGFTGFILSALEGVLEKESLRYIAPLKYFDTSPVFFEDGYAVKYALTAAVVVVVLAAVSFIRHGRSDAPSL